MVCAAVESSTIFPIHVFFKVPVIKKRGQPFTKKHVEGAYIIQLINNYYAVHKIKCVSFKGLVFVGVQITISILQLEIHRNAEISTIIVRYITIHTTDEAINN